MKPNDKAIEAAATSLFGNYMGGEKKWVGDAIAAAYAAQFQSEEYAGLIEELREDALQFDLKDTAYENTAKEAADAIEAVLAERDAAIEERDYVMAEGLFMAENNEDLNETVSKIWKQLGNPTYKELNGRTIHDLIDSIIYERDAIKDLLPNQSREGRVPIPTDWWGVSILERRKRIAAEKERDALAARLAPVDDEALVEMAVREVEKVIASSNDSETVGGARWKALRAAIAAIRPHIEAAALSDLVKFSKHKNWTLKYKMPFCCDDDDQEQCWVVYEEIGSINDRDWDDIGKGKTAAEAIVDALKHER